MTNELISFSLQFQYFIFPLARQLAPWMLCSFKRTIHRCSTTPSFKWEKKRMSFEKACQRVR